MITLNKIHSKFSYYFYEYKRKDIMLLCNAISKQLNLKGKSPYHSVIDNWSKVIQFLTLWTNKKP